MSRVQVLLVAGTHGNELNAPWLFSQWSHKEDLIKNNGISLSRVIGNQAALESCKRYIDRDLNRSFTSELLEARTSNQKEVIRAQELVSIYGPLGNKPCQIAIDFHSTTSSMGTCLVIYGRRPADLALASLIQSRIGIPIYLHEGDQIQNGFLVECWPCGLVVEIGPVAQGLLNEKIVEQTKLSLEICLEAISKLISGESVYPKEVIIHRHLQNIDFPRDINGMQKSYIHRDIQNKDWLPINYGDSLFQSVGGEIIKNKLINTVYPVFINEAAYIEKNIAMSFTEREVWNFNPTWAEELKKLL